MAQHSGGECVAFEADVTKETTLAAMVRPHSGVGDASTCFTTMSA